MVRSNKKPAYPGQKKMSKSSSRAGAVSMPVGPAPPGGPIEIVFSFDTTGSMSGCIAEVRTKVAEVIERLFTDIPGLRVAVFAHGDYCDSRNYVTKWVDFTTDQKNLCDFVKKVGSTGGGDWEECYELVLRQVRTELSWTPGTQRSLVMIGDAIPHPKSDKQNKKNIDWKQEVQQLSSEMGVKIYSVQCHYNERAADFWKDMADMTGGKHVKLDQFMTIIDMIMSICYRETGNEYFLAYEKEVRAREGDKMRSELNLMFDALRDAGAGTSAPSAASAASAASPLSKSPSKPTLKRKSTTPIDDISDDGIADLKKVRGGKTTKAKTVMKKKSFIKAAAKLVAKAKKRTTATSLKHRIPREKIPSTRFLSDLEWTKWYTAFQGDMPTTAAANWSSRNGHHDGFRQHNLFYHNSMSPSVYELAVQPKSGARKYPVWTTATNGFNSVYWDTYLMRNKRIQDQMDDVIKKGAKIFVRRAVMEPRKRIIELYKPKSRGGTETKDCDSVSELRELIHEVYDYPWSVSGSKKTHRQVVKHGIAISKA